MTAADIEATVLCMHLPPWILHGLTVNPKAAIRNHNTYGTAGDGWRTTSSRAGIEYSRWLGYDEQPAVSGTVLWPRVIELVRGAATAELLAGLGDALARYQELAVLNTRDCWARQAAGQQSPITDREAHDAEWVRVHWLIRDLGEQIKDRIRNPHPLGQLDLLDLIGAGA